MRHERSVSRLAFRRQTADCRFTIDFAEHLKSQQDKAV